MPLEARQDLDTGRQLLQAATADWLALGSGGDGGDVPTWVVSSTQQPAPLHDSSHVHCVYVVRWEDGWFYCGETTQMSVRLEQHRMRTRGVLDCEAAYVALSALPGARHCVPLPPGQTARQLEGQVIRRLRDSGVSLWSDHDAARR